MLFTTTLLNSTHLEESTTHSLHGKTANVTSLCCVHLMREREREGVGGGRRGGGEREREGGMEGGGEIER